MQYSVLNSPKNQRGCPEEAAGYVLGLMDASKLPRDYAPIVLSGSKHSFVETALLVPKAPRYLSVTLSGCELFSAACVCYASDIFRNHLVAGIGVKRVANLSVAHPKEQGWDTHELLAITPIGSPKKAAYLRPVADYLRFTHLTSLVNRFFGWADPLDPAHYRPVHVRETWRPWPDAVHQLDHEITESFRSGRINKRGDIVDILKLQGLKPVVGIKTIEFQMGGETWHFVGYGATAHADDQAKLAAHRQRTIRPFLTVRDRPQEATDRVIAQFRERATENAFYHGFAPEDVPAGLIIPDPSFFENFYENRLQTNIRDCAARELDRAINLGLFDRDAPPFGTERTNDHPGRIHAEKLEHIIQPEQPDCSTGTAGSKSAKGEQSIAGMGIQSRSALEGMAPPNTASRIPGQQRGDDDDYTRGLIGSSIKRMQEAFGRIQEVARSLRRITAVPRWMYEFALSRKRRAALARKRLPQIARARPKRVIVGILKTPSPYVFPPAFAAQPIQNPRKSYERHPNL